MVNIRSSRRRRALSTSCSTTPPSKLPSSRQPRGSYKSRSTQWKKMDSICKFMRDNYRWGVKEFLHAYVTEEEEEATCDSVKIRTRKLNEAIFDQKEVLKVVKDNWKPLPQ